MFLLAAKVARIGGKIRSRFPQDLQYDQEHMIYALDTSKIYILSLLLTAATGSITVYIINLI